MRPYLSGTPALLPAAMETDWLPPGVSPSLLSLLLGRALGSSLVPCSMFLGAPGTPAPVAGYGFAAEIYGGSPSLNCAKP